MAISRFFHVRGAGLRRIAGWLAAAAATLAILGLTAALVFMRRLRAGLFLARGRVLLGAALVSHPGWRAGRVRVAQGSRRDR